MLYVCIATPLDRNSSIIGVRWDHKQSTLAPQPSTRYVSDLEAG